MKFRKTKKLAKSYKKRYQKPAILRPLKRPITDTDQILKVSTLVELGSLTNGNAVRFFAGLDGYFTSSGRADAVIAPVQFVAWPAVEFNKMAQAYQQYTIVGLKVEVAPYIMVNGRQTVA